MSRKRICEDCGNKCNDEYCPICGRKTKVYNEASRQEDTLYDAAKYRTTADTKKAESGVFEEKKERIDDSERVREHRYNHPNAKRGYAEKYPFGSAVQPAADYRYRGCGCCGRCDLLSR